jgi:hypothetical protein
VIPRFGSLLFLDKGSDDPVLLKARVFFTGTPVFTMKPKTGGETPDNKSRITT